MALATSAPTAAHSTEPDPRGDEVLDAAKRCVLTFGFGATTLSAVATAAGVGRMTVYRRYADLDEIYSALVRRELRAVRHVAEAAVRPGSTGREALVTIMVAGSAAVTDSELLKRTISHEPEALLRFLTDPGTRSQRRMRTFLARHVRKGQADGTIRPGDPVTMARSLEGLIRTVALQAASDPVVVRTALLELEHIVTVYLTSSV